jgi:hypothetical protein
LRDLRKHGNRDWSDRHRKHDENRFHRRQLITTPATTGL